MCYGCAGPDRCLDIWEDKFVQTVSFNTGIEYPEYLSIERMRNDYTQICLQYEYGIEGNTLNLDSGLGSSDSRASVLPSWSSSTHITRLDLCPTYDWLITIHPLSSKLQTGEFNDLYQHRLVTSAPPFLLSPSFWQQLNSLVDSFFF